MRDTVPDWLMRPKLADGVELAGRMQDTAFETETWLVYRADGQYFQATPVLYRVLELMDGERSLGDMAKALSEPGEEPVPEDDVLWLMRTQIGPMGLIEIPAAVRAEAGGSPAAEQRAVATPFAGLHWRFPLISYRKAERVSNVLQHMYSPTAAVALLTLVVLGHIWFYGIHGLGSSVTTVTSEPYAILFLTAYLLASSLFHEFGHASACNRAGITHGPIGAGLYVVFPVFYADVTHAYRLNRKERLRVDVGGMYFDSVATLLLFAGYFITGWEGMLLAVFVQNLNLIFQFNPFLRFDGYYVFADAIGVPDPFSYAMTYIGSFIPKVRNRVPKLRLKRTARGLFGLYLITIVIGLVYPIVTGAMFVPDILSSTVDQYDELFAQFGDSREAGSVVRMINDVTQMLLLAAFPVGMTLTLGLLAFRLWRGLRSLFRYVAGRIFSPRRPVRAG